MRTYRDLRRLRFQDVDCDDEEQEIPEQYLDCLDLFNFLTRARRDIGPWTLPGLKSKAISTLIIRQPNQSGTPFVHLNELATAQEATKWAQAYVFADCSAELMIQPNAYMPCGVWATTDTSRGHWSLRKHLEAADLPLGILAVMRTVLEELGCCPEGHLDSWLNES